MVFPQADLWTVSQGIAIFREAFLIGFARDLPLPSDPILQESTNDDEISVPVECGETMADTFILQSFATTMSETWLCNQECAHFQFHRI